MAQPRAAPRVVSQAAAASAPLLKQQLRRCCCFFFAFPPKCKRARKRTFVPALSKAMLALHRCGDAATEHHGGQLAITQLSRVRLNSCKGRAHESAWTAGSADGGFSSRTSSICFYCSQTWAATKSQQSRVRNAKVVECSHITHKQLQSGDGKGRIRRRNRSNFWGHACSLLAHCFKSRHKGQRAKIQAARDESYGCHRGL